MPSSANAASSSVNGPMAASVSNVVDSESRGKLVKANRPAAAIISPIQPLLPLAFLFLLASSLLFWPINGAAVTNSRDSEINSVRHELAVYDNEIINEPEITCGPGVVHFVVKTKKGNASAVYVRGQSQNADCTFHDTRNITIELAKCNVRRKREINPNPGIAYQMTLVVQLHPLFVTKVDRAYNVNCFYREKPQDVSVDFGVSDMVTQQLYSEPQLPACTYSVHRDSLNGPRVKYTHVGEQLWHVWECPSRMYSMLLYNCQAIDGKGAEYAIVDSNGCSKDEFLMPQISYSKDLTKAMAASAAFNFPDRNTMSFTCKIKLCMNSDSECRNITPPNCNGKRAKPGIPAGNFNEDTSGEQSLNSTETSPTWASSTRGSSSSGTSQSSVNRSGSSTVVWAPSSTAGQARKEVSGEVIADIEGEQEGSTEAGSTTRTSQSSSSSTATSPTTETASTSAISSSSSQTTPTSPTTTTATTTRVSTESSSSSSGTTEAPKRTTTEEELLSSQERMSSASAEHPAPEGTAAAASSGSSSSTLTDGQRGEAPTQEALVLRTSSELPADFPRPDLLLQKDQALLAPPMKKGAQAAAAASRMERLEKLDESVDKADANWVIGAEEEEATERSRPHRVPEWEVEEEEAATTNDEGGYRGSTKPVQIFDKRGENGGKSARAQRDTTRGPMEEEVVKKAQVIRRKAGGTEGTGVGGGEGGGGGGGHGRRMVDFDISSPELMILDDYEPAAAAQRASSAGAQRSSVQEAPFIDWSSSTDGRRGGAGGGGPSGAAGSANGICLSPIALICAGALLLLLLLVVAVVLIRATRKSAGTMMEHSFYSH